MIEYLDGSEPPSTDLATVAQVKADLGIAGTTEDVVMAARIARFSLLFANWCDRDFALRHLRETIVVEQPRRARLLRHYPTIEIDGATLNGAEVAVRLDGPAGMVTRADGAPWTAGEVVVTYSGGYELPDQAPAALVQAVIEAVRQRRAFSGRDPSLRSFTHEDVNLSFFSEPMGGDMGFSQSVIDLIRPFRRLSV